MSIDETIKLALQHQQNRRFTEAEALYRQVLTKYPNHPDAWNLLATLAQTCGKVEHALEFAKRAISIKPAAEYYYNYGNMLLSARRMDEAIAALQRAILLKPDLAEAYYTLGLVLKGVGRMDEACSQLARAVAIRPDWAEARNGLGVLLKSKGDFDAAAKCYRDAIRIKPDFAGAINNLGMVLKAQGKLDDAITNYRSAIKLEPSSVDALINLGMALFDRGDFEEAIGCYLNAIQINPNSALAYNNMGISLIQMGRLDESMSAFRTAIALDPTMADAHTNLGNVLRERGRSQESVLAHRKAIEIDPKYADAYSNLGVSYKDQGDLSQAMASFRRALELNPNDSDTYNNMGLALKDQGQLDEAILAFRKAIDLKPDSAEAYNNLGAMKDQGRLDEALVSIRRAVELDPKAAEVHSNLVFEVNFHPNYNQADLFHEAKSWANQRTGLVSVRNASYRNDRAPDRKLKIGYVSGDFTYHPVGRFAAPLIERHDRAYFEIHCFSNVTRVDDATSWFRQKADRWHDIRPMSDAAVAELIISEQIDILVDLSLHTAGNRLQVFCRKPAPLQVTYLAYCGTSGMEAMDYLIADHYLLPPQLESFFTEKVVRLPNCYWCYRKLPNSPEVSLPPAVSNGFITFGCLNNFGKISPAAFDAWYELLKAVPNSRLLLHSKEGSHRQAARDRLAEAGIDAERLGFVGMVPLNEYLMHYSSIDIGLDPFPFAGGTTTCDALWMGVPVVTIAGQTTVSRGGLSIMTNVGLPEFVTQLKEDYIRVAAELAADLPRLSHLRATLREEMQVSKLMDEKGFVADIETLYRQMWKDWCK